MTNKNIKFDTWQPKTKEGIDAKIAYLELEANQRAQRMHGLTAAQKAAYAEELIIEGMKKHFPDGVPTKEPSALDKALSRVSRTQQAEQQLRDTQGRFMDDTDHSLFDELTDVLPPRGQY